MVIGISTLCAKDSILKGFRRESKIPERSSEVNWIKVIAFDGKQLFDFSRCAGCLNFKIEREEIQHSNKIAVYRSFEATSMLLQHVHFNSISFLPCALLFFSVSPFVPPLCNDLFI